MLIWRFTSILFWIFNPREGDILLGITSRNKCSCTPATSKFYFQSAKCTSQLGKWVEPIKMTFHQWEYLPFKLEASHVQYTYRPRYRTNETTAIGGFDSTRSLAIVMSVTGRLGSEPGQPRIMLSYSIFTTHTPWVHPRESSIRLAFQGRSLVKWIRALNIIAHTPSLFGDHLLQVQMRRCEKSGNSVGGKLL